MTVKKLVTPERFIGVSTDSKPTDGATSVRPGATFYEYDSDLMYITYDGTNWVTKASLDTIGVLAAGTNLIGKTGIDQVTANANEVVVKAGASRIGTVSGVLKTVSVTKVLVAATAYDATDVLSESATNTVGTSWLFAAIARANGASGYITKAQVISETTALTPRLVLYLFNAVPTCELDDHATNTCPLYADQANYIGKIEFPALSEVGAAASNAVATPSTYGNLPLEFDCAAGADDLYGVLVTLDAFTQGVGDDMVVKLTAEQY